MELHPALRLDVVAIEMGTFGWTTIMVANFTVYFKYRQFLTSSSSCRATSADLSDYVAGFRLGQVYLLEARYVIGLIFVSSLIYTIQVGLKLAKKVDDLSMNLIGQEIVFLIFSREKITKIILGFDPSNFSQQINYFVSEISRKLKTSMNASVG